jgi:multidrug transporter EmrE-like cation transporter
MGSALLLVAYVAMSCVGLYMLKAAPGWKTPMFGAGFLLYAGGAALWLVILRLLPLSFAFPVAAGSLVIGTLLTGIFFLAETVTLIHATGAMLILAGITLIAVNR